MRCLASTLLVVFLALPMSAVPASAAPVALTSVRLGTDTSGDSIQAHGGGMAAACQLQSQAAKSALNIAGTTAGEPTDFHGDLDAAAASRP